jgi:hypothetical protein
MIQKETALKYAKELGKYLTAVKKKCPNSKQCMYCKEEQPIIYKLCGKEDVTIKYLTAIIKVLERRG